MNENNQEGQNLQITDLEPQKYTDQINNVIIIYPLILIGLKIYKFKFTLL